MANHIQLRRVITKANMEAGSGEHETWEYRTKDVDISILGVSLGGVDGLDAHRDRDGLPNP